MNSNWVDPKTVQFLEDAIYLPLRHAHLYDPELNPRPRFAALVAVPECELKPMLSPPPGPPAGGPGGDTLHTFHFFLYPDNPSIDWEGVTDRSLVFIHNADLIDQVPDIQLCIDHYQCSIVLLVNNPPARSLLQNVDSVWYYFRDEPGQRIHVVDAPPQELVEQWIRAKLDQFREHIRRTEAQIAIELSDDDIHELAEFGACCHPVDIEDWARKVFSTVTTLSLLRPEAEGVTLNFDLLRDPTLNLLVRMQELGTYRLTARNPVAEQRQLTLNTL